MAITTTPETADDAREERITLLRPDGRSLGSGLLIDDAGTFTVTAPLWMLSLDGYISTRTRSGPVRAYKVGRILRMEGPMATAIVHPHEDPPPPVA